MSRPDPEELLPFLAAGYEPIPLHRWDAVDGQGRPRGKTPRDPRWRQTPYPPESVIAWMREGGNVGLRLRATDLVLDHDARNVPPGREVLREFAKAAGLDLSRCPRVVTGSGNGSDHFYLTHASGAQLVGKLDGFPGLEFKSVGRQVVAPGSVHPNGNLYFHDPTSPPPSEAPPISDAMLALIRRPERAPWAGPRPIGLERALGCLAQLDPSDYREHDAWLELMMAFHAATGGDAEGREEFVAWSTGDPPYAEHAEIIRGRWDSLDAGRLGGVTYLTLFRQVRDAGGTVPHDAPEDDFEDLEVPAPYAPKFERRKDGMPKATVANGHEAIKGLGLAFAWDEFSHRIVVERGVDLVRPYYPNASEWNERVVLALRRLLIERYGLELGIERVYEIAATEAVEHPFDPLIDYLESLRWDGMSRLDDWLCTYAGAARTPYVRGVGRMMLVGAVARATVPGIRFRAMVVLEGRQGIGKSRLLKVLGGDYTLEGLPSRPTMADRDVIQAIVTAWIVEIDELADLSKADVNALKGFITRTADSARFAYAKLTETYPRRCILVGTTNDATYLRDITGNTRFFPVEVHQIRHEALERDRDQLWAEAVCAWKADSTYKSLELPPALEAAAAAEQEARRTIDPWEELVASALDAASAHVTTQELIEQKIGRYLPNTTDRDFKRLAAIMRRLGWKPTKVPAKSGKYVNGWVRED